jgi:hypothetical protein
VRLDTLLEVQEELRRADAFLVSTGNFKSITEPALDQASNAQVLSTVEN